MLNNAQLQMQSWLRASGIYCSISNDGDPDVNVFIDFRDCTKKAQQKLVTAQIKKLGLRSDVSDKGLHIFAA